MRLRPETQKIKRCEKKVAAEVRARDKGTASVRVLDKGRMATESSVMSSSLKRWL